MSQQKALLGRLVPVQKPGNRAKRDLGLHQGKTTIGRAPNNDVVVSDPEISKNHAEIVADDHGVLLRDLKSSNGTFVNGKGIREHRLQPEDVVEFGASIYRFSLPQEARSSVSIVPSSEEKPDTTRLIASSSMDDFEFDEDNRDFDELQKRFDRVRGAFEAVQGLIEITDIRALCGRILDVTFELLNVESGAVVLFDEQHRLIPWASRSTGKGGAASISISRTIVDQVVQERSAILAADASTDVRWSSVESVVISGVRSLMCVPLLKGDKIYGILHVTNSHENGMFSQNDLELMTGIGSGGGVALANAFLSHQLAEEGQARESLGRFLSPHLVEQVLSHNVALERGGEERELTVMFADIRGFTSLTERTPASEVVELLNEYFDLMVEVVFKHHGVLDKFIGDALMAVWGTPQSSEDDAKNAIAAAQEMLETLESLNASRHDQGLEPIQAGIGLASGPCVAGNMGARRRMEYTHIGDRVNLAARLCGMAPAGELFCDAATYERGGRPDRAVALPPAQVKGKSEAVAVYRIGWRDESLQLPPQDDPDTNPDTNPQRMRPEETHKR